MITKREWHLLAVVVFLLVMVGGGVLNFLAIVNNNGQMPFLTKESYWEGYNYESYFSTSSCENIKYCFAVDRYGGIFNNYLVMFSIGDVIILFGAIICIGCLIRWRYLVRKDEIFEEKWKLLNKHKDYKYTKGELYG